MSSGGDRAHTSGYINPPGLESRKKAHENSERKNYSHMSRPLYVGGKYVGGRYGLTAPEAELKLSQREVEIRNLLSLRKEYNRYVRPRGWKSAVHNPFIPLGLGTVIFTFVYSMIKAKDAKTTARMLGWRVQAQGLTVAAIIAGFALQGSGEMKWIKEQSEERNLPINEADLSRSLNELNRYIESSAQRS